MKINQRTLSAIKPGIRRIEWDDGLPGFGVRVTEGATTYVVDFKVGSRRRRVSLGRTDLIKYQAARDRAGEIIVAARKGLDLTVDHRQRHADLCRSLARNDRARSAAAFPGDNHGL